MLEESRTAHPYFWAGFVLSGDGGIAEEITEKKEAGIGVYFVLALALVLMGTAGVLIARRRT